MDDELRRWAATFKQMEGLDMGIVQRAQSAYRFDAVRQLLEVLGLGVAVVLTAILSAQVLSRGDVSAATWTIMGVMWSANVFAIVFVGYWARRQAKGRQLLSDSPQSLVTDLVRVHEHELQIWVNKWGLAFCGILSVAGLAFAGNAAIQLMAAGKSLLAAWGPLGFAVLSLLALGVFGRRRVGFLRRELRSLRDIQRELDATEGSAS